MAGISSVDLTSYGTGVHNFRSSKFKKVLKSISIGSSGSGYTNQRTTTNISGIKKLLKLRNSIKLCIPIKKEIWGINKGVNIINSN